MNYRTGEYLGAGEVAVGTTILGVGKAGIEYYQATREADEYKADMNLIGAQNTADARTAARRAGYQERFEKIFGTFEKERIQRYLIIGGAIGIPLIVLLVFSKKKG